MLLVFWYAYTCVGNGKEQEGFVFCFLLKLDLDYYFSPFCKFYSIAAEVQQYLADSSGVSPQKARHGMMHKAGQFQFFFRGLWSQHIRDIFDRDPEVEIYCINDQFP